MNTRLSVKNFRSIATKCGIMSRILDHGIAAPNTMTFCIQRCIDMLSEEVARHGAGNWGNLQTKMIENDYQDRHARYERARYHGKVSPTEIPTRTKEMTCQKRKEY